MTGELRRELTAPARLALFATGLTVAFAAALGLGAVAGANDSTDPAAPVTPQPNATHAGSHSTP